MNILDIDGKPLAPESIRMLDYLRTRSEELGNDGIRARVKAAADELEGVVAQVAESERKARPNAGTLNIAEVVDHIAQTQIRSAEELRHLFNGRRPPGPPVYEALRTGAPGWAHWQDLVEGLHSANRELIDLLGQAPGLGDGAEGREAPKVLTIMVVTTKREDGSTGPQIFPMDLGWREYAILQRLHLLDHRTQIKKLRAMMTAA
jgi:hypothetical protein